MKQIISDTTGNNICNIDVVAFTSIATVYLSVGSVTDINAEGNDGVAVFFRDTFFGDGYSMDGCLVAGKVPGKLTYVGQPHPRVGS